MEDIIIRNLHDCVFHDFVVFLVQIVSIRVLYVANSSLDCDWSALGHLPQR